MADWQFLMTSRENNQLYQGGREGRGPELLNEGGENSKQVWLGEGGRGEGAVLEAVCWGCTKKDDEVED